VRKRAVAIARDIFMQRMRGADFEPSSNRRSVERLGLAGSSPAGTSSGSRAA
jgi:hypothetical protein